MCWSSEFSCHSRYGWRAKPGLPPRKDCRRNSLEKEECTAGIQPWSKFYSMEPETALLEYVYHQCLAYEFVHVTCERWGLWGGVCVQAVKCAPAQSSSLLAPVQLGWVLRHIWFHQCILLCSLTFWDNGLCSHATCCLRVSWKALELQVDAITWLF